jgi:hypothetical protein
LKSKIEKGEFELQQPVQMFPQNTSLKSLEETDPDSIDK